MSDAILTLYFQPGANIDPNRFNSIFSTLVTLVIKVGMRFQHINIRALSDASINNRNRFNSIFFRWLPSLNKKEYESTIKIFLTSKSVFSSFNSLVCKNECNYNIFHLNDSFLALFFQPGANINPNRFNLIFSSLLTLVQLEGDFRI